MPKTAFYYIKMPNINSIFFYIKYIINISFIVMEIVLKMQN